MKILIAASIFLFLIAGCSKEQKIVTMDSGLKYMDDTLGTGREAKLGDLVTIHFKGWIVKDSTNLFSDWSKDTTKLAESIGDSKLSGKPYKYVLDGENFIKGSNEGIVGMKVGGTRTLLIPSKLAYGEKGLGPIPPNSELKVVVELLDVKDAITAEKWDVDSTKVKTTKSGLKYVIIDQGAGAKPDSGSVVSVNYTGYLTNGKKFDSSVERDEPFTFTLGVGQVIPGWDEGIKLLNKGGKAELIIPPSLAYGPRSVGQIPPNSTLVFDVELVDIK